MDLRLELVGVARLAAVGVALALATPLLVAASENSPILTNRGYALYQDELARRLGEYEVDGRSAPLAECLQAGPRCRELVECTWSLVKAAADPSDPELPLVCITMVSPDPASRVRSEETVCTRLQVGDSESYIGRVASPLDDTAHWFRLTLRVDLRDDSGQRVEQIAVAQQMWRLEARVEETAGGTGRWLPGLAIAVGSILIIVLLSRSGARSPSVSPTARRGAPRARAETAAAPPTPAVASRTDMGLEVYPAELPADGRSTARVVVQLSRGGKPLAGQTIELSGDDPPAVLRFKPSRTATDLDGVARADYVMPRGSNLARLSITAEATLEDGRRLSRTRAIRVAQPRLSIHPTRSVLPLANAAPVPFRASLASDSGNPLPDIDLLAEVVPAGSGTVEPNHRRTDAQGVVVFRFIAGAKRAPATIRIWPAGCPEAAAEVVLEPT